MIATDAAVLAGGRGRRMGSAKPAAELGGRRLIEWPLAAVAAAGLAPFVVAKPGTALPPLDVPVVREADDVHHPLAGVLAALAHAARPVVVVAADMPFLEAELLRRLASEPGTVVAAVTPAGLEPLCARYSPLVASALAQALREQAPLRRTLAALEPVTLPVAPATVASVNTPAELAAAAARLVC